MQHMTLNKISIEHITLEHIGFVHHGFGVDLPDYLLSIPVLNKLLFNILQCHHSASLIHTRIPKSFKINRQSFSICMII